MIAGETSLAYEQVVTLNLVRHDNFMIHNYTDLFHCELMGEVINYYNYSFEIALQAEIT